MPWPVTGKAVTQIPFAGADREPPVTVPAIDPGCPRAASTPVRARRPHRHAG